MTSPPTTPTCPACGAASIEIVYGLPGPELIDAAERGEVILGGCCIIVDAPMPNWGCPSCDEEWHIDAPSDRSSA